MSKFLLALMMTVVVASLQAITIQWTVPSSGSVSTTDGWEDWTGELTGASIYLVYSQTEWKTADQVWDANSGLKVALGNDGKATITDLSNKSDVTASQPSTWMNFSGNNQINMLTSISGTDGFGLNGYYYLVVFDPTPKSLPTTYLQMAPCPGMMSHFPSFKQKLGCRSQRL